MNRLIVIEFASEPLLHAYPGSRSNTIDSDSREGVIHREGMAPKPGKMPVAKRQLSSGIRGRLVSNDQLVQRGGKATSI